MTTDFNSGRGIHGLRRLLALVTLLALTTACSPPAPLTIALHPWIGYETLSLAEQFGWLPDDVSLLRGDSSRDSLAALREGRAQAAALTLDEALRLRAELPALRVVLVMDESAGADRILARPGIHTLQGLAGRAVALEDSAVSTLLLDTALERAGLVREQLTIVDLPVDAHAAAYAAGEVDAAVSFLPYASVLADLGARPLMDSRAMPGMILDVLVVDGAALDGREAPLRAAIAAHFQALAHLRSSRDDAIYRFAGIQGQSSDAIREALDGVRLPDAEWVRARLDTPDALAPTVARLVKLGVVPEQPMDDLFSAAFLPPVALP